MHVFKEAWALLQTTWVSSWEFWSCQLLSVTEKTCKGYKCLVSRLPSIPRHSAHKQFRMIDTEGSFRAKSLHSVSNKCWIVLLWLITQSLSTRVLVLFQRLIFWLLMSQEGTTFAELLLITGLKNINYWIFFPTDFTSAFSSSKLFLVQSRVYQIRSTVVRLHYSVTLEGCLINIKLLFKISCFKFCSVIVCND